VFLLFLLSCSPRDFLTRRLAADLITNAPPFRDPQLFWLRTGAVSNRDFNSPESLVLRHRGWIIGTQQACPPGVEPAPCWDVLLSPIGVDVFSPLISSAPSGSAAVSVRAARREIVAITGITKAGAYADVEFIWHWVALNPVGAALYDEGVHYRTVVAFRAYDDGWRVIDKPVRHDQNLEDALHNSEPIAP